MAKALFRARLAERGCSAVVASAGFLPGGVEPPGDVVEVMKDRGIDIAGHRSRTISAELILRADLVATMTRQQLLEVVTSANDAWSRCFTLTDLVRRGEAVGPIPEGVSLATWVQRVHGSRSRSSLLGLALDDDIDDPMQGRPSGFRHTADELDDLVGRLAALLCPEPEPRSV